MQWPRIINLEIQFAHELTEHHGEVRIGRAVIPLQLTERVNLRARIVTMCEGWKISVVKNEILVLGYHKLRVIIPWEFIQRVVIS